MPSRKLTQALSASLFALAALVAPRAASACWDGYAATVGDVTLRHGMAVGQWSPDHARHTALWGTRIEALLPLGAHLEVDNGQATCSGSCGKVGTIAVGTDDLPRLFREASRAFRVLPSRVREVLALAPQVFTVQVHAGSARSALSARKRVNDLYLGLGGFFEEGGFPASNPEAHVLRDARGMNRTVVGVFLTRAAADAARATLATKGISGFVRALPSGVAVEERSFSNIG
jgi:hypothetical protein